MINNPHNPPSEPRQPFAAHVRRVAASGGAIVLIAGLVASSALADGDGGISSGGGGGGGAAGDGSGGKHAYVFPLPSQHSYGNGPGGGHQGQDVLGGCGRKLVAARSGRVQQVAYQGSGAGHYVVIDGEGTGVDTVYMHLKDKAIPREGSRIRQGEKIGEVGSTGNATACLLHFEKWTAPGYYQGGSFSSGVTRALREWDKWS